MNSTPDLIIIGAGFFGATLATKFCEDFPRKSVLLIEKRSTIGGNAYSYRDAKSGIDVHKYGIHIFHTSNLKVENFIRQFSSFNNYEHRVKTKFENAYFDIPINLSSISQVYGQSLNPREAESLIADEIRASRKLIEGEDNLESKAISLVGEKIYNSLIRGYTLKQWQTDPKNLPAAIINRLPVRYNFDNRYFQDSFQGIPQEGYTKIFEKMLASPRITIQLDTNYFRTPWAARNDTLKIFTGPLDQYFSFKYGPLGWRTLDFETNWFPENDYQGLSQINEADIEVPWTRTLEFKHLQPERFSEMSGTVVTKEFSRAAFPEDEPYYPINGIQDKEALAEYRKLAALEPNTIFGGRLGSYKYLDMHMAIASALTTYENEVKPRF
jgi:UDP-galactopyranose mutase